MYSSINKQKIGTITNEQLVNHPCLTITNLKTSSECNRNYNTAIFTSTIQEKPKLKLDEGRKKKRRRND